ncbi:hypothetical protein ACH5BF_10670 [Arcobacter sp. YIC-464]|uniref:hypothetical protein n=1 Tax=Arcobacter sp. YIC-464 TaxID=3376631 RepID=UPI003C23D50A
MNLSKSLYTKGIQCPKSLWLKKYKPSVLTPPDESAQAIFETGNIVGNLACTLFPDGKEVSYTKDFDEMISTTKEFLEEGISNIYEATFNFDGILIMVDILNITDNTINIYEVKSSAEVKDIYIHDVSIKYYVLKNALEPMGYKINSTNVVHINSEYTRGDELDINQLFKIVDVTSQVQALQKDIPNTLSKFSEILSEKELELNIDI